MKTKLAATFFLICLWLLYSPELYAQEKPDVPAQEKEYIAVMDLDIEENVDKSIRIPLSSRLRQELMMTQKYKVLDRDSMDEILSEQQLSLEDCTTSECALKVGRLLIAAKIVTGNVSKKEETHSICARLIDLETGVITKETDITCKDCDFSQLKDSMRDLAIKLVGLEKILGLEKRPELGRGGLHLESQPSGATVYLDAQELKEKTPIIKDDLVAGQYLVELSKGNYAAKEVIDIEADKLLRKTIPLEKLKGQLTIITDPPEATVEVDGEKLDERTPLVLYKFPSGKHFLQINKEGYFTRKGRIRVSPWDPTRIKVELKEAGGLTVTSEPSEATVFLDGTKRGFTPLKLTEVEPGEREVLLKKEGYFDWRKKKATVQAGKMNEVTAVLKSRYGTIKITSYPPGAQIYLNDKTETYWKTPYNLRALIGKHRISLQLYGYDPYINEEVVVESGEELAITGDLKIKDWYYTYRKEKRRKNIWTWSSMAAGIALGSASGFFFYDAAKKDDEADEVYPDYQGSISVEDINKYRSMTESLRDDARNRRIAAYSMLGVGVVGLSIGTYNLLTFPEKPLSEEPVANSFKFSIQPIAGGDMVGAKMVWRIQ